MKASNYDVIDIILVSLITIISVKELHYFNKQGLGHQPSIQAQTLKL